MKKDIYDEEIKHFDKIISPIVTEKSTNQSELNKVVFKVNKKFNKKIIKKNIEKIFKVENSEINIVNKKPKTKVTRGKKVKAPGFKKAIVTLKKGQNIYLTTGI